MNQHKFIKNSWSLIPLIIYIILFLFNPIVQKYAPIKCEQNVITFLDLWLFKDNLYTFLSNIQNSFLDVITAIPYLFHFTLPFIYIIYLIRSKKSDESILRFLLTFGLTNMFGVLIQYCFPTPPPWMLLMDKSIPEANFFRVDTLIGFKLFKSLYAQSKLVCGAFPSLHTAWPSVIYFSGNYWIGRWFCFAHVCLIAFSAVYSMHHYLIDVVFGILLAFLSNELSRCFSFVDDGDNKEKSAFVWNDV
ncbi:unnamed protein product [Brachionus calyciflorus]|uniref:Inositolphosphotransferase Aur1/Ipt1 domain-containing protein n=1 Tax=Brachionus calyciflorus TaxID=104777 RepID=A0A814FCG3_9BILA|nr:unnamed protein product [Brachionus calyciflorus]